MRMGKYYEEFEIGEKGEGNALTITDTHLVMFGSITGDFNALHFNDEVAKKGIFGGRIAHGLFILSLASGGLGDPVQGTVVGNMGISAKFMAPSRIGDTITPGWEVMDKKPRGKSNGVVSFKITCTNQKGELVMEGEEHLLMLYKNKQA